MRLDNDGLAVEDLVTAVRRAAAVAGTGEDLVITGLELTLHAVAKREYGSKLEFRIPVIGMPVSFGSRVSRQDTHRIKVNLAPAAVVHEVRGGEVEESLVQAISTIRAVVAAGAAGPDAFEHRSSEVELSFAVTDSGSIALVGTADLAGEVTHTLKLALGPA
jgi:hypothetical protein